MAFYKKEDEVNNSALKNQRERKSMLWIPWLFTKRKMDPETPRSVALSRDNETEGFDLQAGESWIYPTNYPTRDYQFNIIQNALFKNTLVSLPTGLGKTFIAAVVMYNFYRWYPHGKIIFMAPTRPLVKQQIDACYNIMAIPQEATAELTGTKTSSSRSDIWVNKRVFFVTPQVLQNDLENVVQLSSKIKCLVFDEAHKAKGNHAYCQVTRKLLSNNHQFFRVLALSATPGSSINDISEVVCNLLISHLEFRTEESLDVRPYVFERSLETVVVPLSGKLIEIRDDYLKILEQYTKTLIEYKIVQGNCVSLTKGKIFMVMKDFQSKYRGAGSSNYSEVMRCLNICITLYHAFELLIRHGLRNFLSFFEEHIEKPLLRGNYQLRQILSNVRNYLGPIPNIEVLPDGSYPEIPTNIKFGHPKHYKLRDVLISHFSKENMKNTRVIVFFEYRESVMEAHTLLLQSRPLIRPKIFLGQGSGITQKIQLGVVKAFREGKCNTLLSTCIGEEGLDVGEVDLIVCFDISNKSPIRMVQRMGRTGRKRAGSVLILVTEGKEQQTLKDCLIHKNNITTHILGSVQVKNDLYASNPRLVPEDINPRCEKIFITVKERGDKKKQSTLDKFKKSSDIAFSQSSDVSIDSDLIPDAKIRCLTADPMEKSQESRIFSRHIDKLRTPNRVHSVKHTVYTTMLNELLCSADSKRFNIPSATQCDISGKSLKQGDIRNMFFKDKGPKAAEEDGIIFSLKSPPQDYNYEIEEKSSSQKTSLELEGLVNLLSDYLVSDLTSSFNTCSYCPGNFYCDDFAISSDKLQTFYNNNTNSQTLIPSKDLINSINLDDIENYIAVLDENYYSTHKIDSEDLDDFDMMNVDELASPEKTFTFEAPKTYSVLLESFREHSFIAGESQVCTLEKRISEKELLRFFKLESIHDMFDDAIDTSQNTIIYEPDKELQKVDSTEIAESNVDNEETRDLDDEETQVLNDVITNSFSETNKKPLINVNMTSIDDFCDLSYFGLGNFSKTDRSAESFVQENKTKEGESANSSIKFNVNRDNFVNVDSIRNDKSFEVQLNSSKLTMNNAESCRSNEQSRNKKIGDEKVKKDIFKIFNLDFSHEKAISDSSFEFDLNVGKLNLSSTKRMAVSTTKQAKSSINLLESGSDCETQVDLIDSITKFTAEEKLNLSKSHQDVTNSSFEFDLTNSKLNMNIENVNAKAGDDSEHSSLEFDLDSSNLLPRHTANSKEPKYNLNESHITITQMVDIFNKPSGRESSKNKMALKKLWDKSKVSPQRANYSDDYNSSDEFVKENTTPKSIREEAHSPIIKSKKKRGRIRKRAAVKSKEKKNVFLDLEAVVSEDENVFISDDEDDLCPETYDKSFVNDATQQFNTELHGMYLRSVRSPARHKKVQRKRPLMTLEEIYSQPPINEDNDYLEDSFCVEGNEENLTQIHEMSELEILEQKLENKKKRKNSEATTSKAPKRRRIICLSSDESE